MWFRITRCRRIEFTHVAEINRVIASRELSVPLFRFAVADANPPIVSDPTILASIAAARCEALMFAGRVLSDQKASFWDEDDWVLTVSDEQNLTLFTITVATASAPATAKYSSAIGT